MENAGGEDLELMEEDDYDQEEEEDEDELDDLQPHLMWGHHGARAAAANVANEIIAINPDAQQAANPWGAGNRLVHHYGNRGRERLGQNVGVDWTQEEVEV